MIGTFDGIELNDDIIWINEGEGSIQPQSVKIAIDGTPHFFHGDQTGTRTMSIDCGWISKFKLNQIRNIKAESPQRQVVLSLSDGRSFNVYFDHSSNPIIETPIIERPEYTDSDQFEVILNLFLVNQL